MNDESSNKVQEVSAAEKRVQQRSKLLNIVTFGVVLVVALILAMTNPSKGSFDAYLENRMEQIEQDEELGFVEKMAGKVVGLQAELTASYQSYIFFSTVDAKFGKEDYTYIGIVGTWFILNEPTKD